MKTEELMEKAKEIAKKHELVNESGFSYFPELEQIRSLFTATFQALDKYREKNGLSQSEDIEIFVDYEGFRFTIGEIYGPYDQVYIYLKENEQAEYVRFEEVFTML